MVRPVDIPKYLMHSVSKRHSPTVATSVAAPGPLVLRNIIRSEMETAQVLLGVGDLSIESVDILMISVVGGSLSADWRSGVN